MPNIAKVNSEIRIDEIHDRFVIIAPKRLQRPHDVVIHHEVPVKSKDCPFCKEMRMLSQKPLYQVGPEQWWEIKVIKNIFPVVSLNTPKTYGTQEVIIETPHHNKELAEFSEDHIVRLLKAYVARTKTLSDDKKIKYVLVFKNHGGTAGASLVHAHSQIFASGFLPPHITEKLTNARRYRIEHGICYYCHMVDKEMHGPRKIAGDKFMAAFTPYASNYNYEAWIIPRRHVDNITLLEEEELRSLAKFMKLIIKRINTLQLPYNFYLHQAVTEKDEHLYLRICPRRDIWAGIEMGSRLIINSVAPEAAAKFYRGKN
jgi:UDPglucose--hexose-1-phosphate uridylyltransferase